jgi:CBS domain-containing protein
MTELSQGRHTQFARRGLKVLARHSVVSKSDLPFLPLNTQVHAKSCPSRARRERENSDFFSYGQENFASLFLFLRNRTFSRVSSTALSAAEILLYVNNTKGVIPMKVKDLMRTHVVTLHSMDMLGVAEDIMSMGRIRHLPVVDTDNRVVGMVTQRDLYKASISSVLGFDRTKEHEWLGKVKVQDVMTKTVTMIGSEAGVVEAVDKMVMEKIGCLPVIDEQGKLMGLLTETDCLRCFRDLLKRGTFKEWLS